MMSVSIEPTQQITAQASERPPFPIHRFTVEEYHRMGEIGVLTEDDRVELLEGWIAPKMIRKPPHDAVIDLVQEALRSRVPTGWRIRIQSAVVTADSEPEPDLAVVRGTARDYISRHPAAEDTALVIEVADTSLERDHFKRQVYARAGIPSYWIINLVDALVETYTDPSGPVEPPKYKTHKDYAVNEAIPLVIAGQPIGKVAVSEVLP